MPCFKDIYLEAAPGFTLSKWSQCMLCACDWTPFCFLPRKNPSYHSFPPEGVFTNTLGLLILVFGALIFWIVTRPQWKRPREPGSVPLQLNGGNADGMEGAIAISSAHNMDAADAELSSEGAARKRTLGLVDTGQRSTM